LQWGAAFELAGTPEEQQQVIQYLEWREKQYDVRLTLPVYAANPEAAGNASQSTAGAAAGGNAAAGTPAAAAAAATNSQTAAAEGGQPAAAAVDGQAGAASTRAAAEGAQPAVAAAVVYYATDNPATNVNFLGPAPQDAIAAQIAAAVGPSGPNYEYVYKLADAMRQVRGHRRGGSDRITCAATSTSGYA
jgi:cation transport regulator ChaC